MAGRIGPRTPEGKVISRANSTRHGLRSRGLLRCRREQCFFYDGCEIAGDAERWATVSYGDACPAEQNIVTAWRESDYGIGRFNRDNPEDCAVLEGLIEAEIQLMRAEKLVQMNLGGDALPLYHPEKDTPAELVRLRDYYRRARGRKMRALTEATPFLKGMIATDKFKRELVEYYQEHYGK